MTFWESLHNFKNSQPLLLVGLPRSGTSLAQIFLNYYSDVFISYESIMEPYMMGKNKYKLAAFYYESLGYVLIKCW